MASEGRPPNYAAISALRKADIRTLGHKDAPDDAEFEPPHPIFQLAQERDNYADKVRNLLALIAEQRKAALDYLEMTDKESWLQNDFALRVNLIKALSLTHDSVMLKEVGSMENDMRTGHTYNILFNDGMAQPIGTKLYTIVKGEAG